MKYLYLFFFIFNLNYIVAKELDKPYYEFLSLQEIKDADIYDKWVPMYQSKTPKETKIEVTKEIIENFKNLYDSSNIIGVFNVTHFKIYSCSDTESGLCVKFKATIKNLIKGIYTDKNIIFDGDFDNASNAESYEQIYILYQDKEGKYYSDEFFQFNVSAEILNIFNKLNTWQKYKTKYMTIYYPTFLTLASNDKPHLLKKTQYKYKQYKDGRDGVIEMNELYDFDMTLKLYDNFQEALQENYLTDGYDFNKSSYDIDEPVQKIKDGYSIRTGSEGIGEIYFMQIKHNKTLVGKLKYNKNHIIPLQKTTPFLINYQQSIELAKQIILKTTIISNEQLLKEFE